MAARECAGPDAYQYRVDTLLVLLISSEDFTSDFPLQHQLFHHQWNAEQFRGKVSSTPSFIVTGKVSLKGYSFRYKSAVPGKGRLKVTLQK